MNDDCLFCRIAKGELDTPFIYESERVVGFDDINPQAPLHALFIPREHIATLNDVGPEHEGLLGEMMLAARQVAAERGVADDGYRLNLNCNRHGGQSVYHIHLHLLGGRALGWPPG